MNVMKYLGNPIADQTEEAMTPAAIAPEGVGRRQVRIALGRVVG